RGCRVRRRPSQHDLPSREDWGSPLPPCRTAPEGHDAGLAHLDRGRAAMSVRKNPRGPGYEVRLRVGGQRRFRVVRTQKLALALERQWQDEQDARRLGLPVDRGPIAFGDLCDRYLAQHQVTARTLRSLRERLVYSRRPFGTTPVRELLAEEIGRWNASLPVGATMRGHCLRAMAQVLDAGVRWGYLPTNPAREVRRPSASVHEVRPFESWDEVEAVANAAGTY